MSKYWIKLSPELDQELGETKAGELREYLEHELKVFLKLNPIGS